MGGKESRESKGNGGTESRTTKRKSARNQPPGTNVPAPWENESTVPYGWQPWHSVRNEFDRWLQPFIRGWAEGGPFSSRNARWDLDVEDRDDALVVRAEAPGFEPGDFDVQILGDRLTLCACHESESDDEDSGSRGWSRQEYRRTISLPPGIEGDKVDAKYKNGVLTVKLPKGENGRGRRIQVKGG